MLIDDEMFDLFRYFIEKGINKFKEGGDIRMDILREVK